MLNNQLLNKLRRSRDTAPTTDSESNSCLGSPSAAQSRSPQKPTTPSRLLNLQPVKQPEDLAMRLHLVFSPEESERNWLPPPVILPSDEAEPVTPPTRFMPKQAPRFLKPGSCRLTRLCN